MIAHDLFFTVTIYGTLGLVFFMGWLFHALHDRDQSTSDERLALNLRSITCPGCGALLTDAGRGHTCQATYTRPYTRPQSESGEPLPPPTARYLPRPPLALGPGR